jgi:hypothetical protein
MVEGTSSKTTKEDGEELGTFLFFQPHCFLFAVKIKTKHHLKQRILPLPFQ